MQQRFRLTGPLWLCATILLAACGGQPEGPSSTPTMAASEPATEAPTAQVEEAEPTLTDTPEPTAAALPFELSTSAYAEGAVIPDRYACTGEDLSPEFTWGDPPEGTQSFVLLFDDPDAFGWVHWLLFNLPPELRSLPEAVENGAGLPTGTLEGATSWGSQGYRGPCPPAGAPHTYVFTLYALDTTLNLDAGVDVDTIQVTIAGHVLAEIQYSGEFSR